MIGGWTGLSIMARTGRDIAVTLSLLTTVASAAPGLATERATPRAARTGFAGFPQHGPYQVRMYADPGLPGRTIYAPATPNGRRLPIVLWGNGGCSAVGNRYARFLTDLASQGMLVIAIGTIEDERYATDPTAEPLKVNGPSKPGDPAQSDYSQLASAIDWAIAQNAAPKSALYRRVNPRKIAALGHSCGGLQALAVASRDPRVTTTVLMNSGVWNKGPGGLPGADVTKASLANVRGSIAYLSGDASDPAAENSRDDFDRIKHVPALWAYHAGTGHGGMFWKRGDDEYARVASAWLRWRLLDQPHAARLFTGRNCGLCAISGWTVHRKGMDGR